MFYAFYDTQVNCYRENGLNSTCPEEAIEQIVSYLNQNQTNNLFSEVARKEIIKETKKMLDKTIPIKERIAMIEAYDFVFKSSEEKFPENC